MRRSTLSRWQWLAVIFTAAGMLALLIYLTQVSFSKAVAVSTVLTLFVAVAALLVSVISLRPSEAAQPATRSITVSGEPRTRRIALAPLEPLAVATALLGIALCTFASDALLKYSASWPWWVAAAVTFLGFAAASSGVKPDLIRAAILIFNTLWFFSYSVMIVEYRQSLSSGSIGQLAILSWIGAAANVLFLAIVTAQNFRGRRVPASRLGWQPFLLSCLAFGMGLTAIALRGSSNVPWDLAGWIFTGALLADLCLLLRAPPPSTRERP